ncbi:Enzymatic polyprotein [Caligus rogercresseyi]|uniref:Enzymatic polyprotein n=1 Tax=Caligus rogercresseyi TaxID=217165 RepID=A0A7T8HKP2_CALRO|nr:Enzymatic polyprotein [Caligus rogercresseyi]
MEKSVKLTLNAVSLQDPKLEEVRLKTETDPVLLKLKEVIVDGFPEHKANLDTALRDYWGIRDKLSIFDGLYHVRLQQDCHPDIAAKTSPR